MIRIESVHNEKIKQYAKLKEKKQRDQQRQFLVEGEHLIQEALKAGLVDVLLHVEAHPFSYEGMSISVTQQVMDKLSQCVSQVAYIAVCHFMEERKTDGNRVLLLCDVQDPGNVGTMIRTALSFGFDQVIVSPQCADIYNEKVIRATQGALFHVPVKKQLLQEAIPQLQEHGFQVYGTAFEQAVPLKQIAGSAKMAFVMGNEGQGVHKEVLALCDQRVFIEMRHFDSLNVAIAAAILMYEHQGEVR